MANVIGILVCYSLIVILAMPDRFAMPHDEGEDS
jgi:hypothetical protein